ncbi:hypothetical protein M8J76_005707 [Diaphorina citri]|nr:hypothetical protein M8J75_014323 [Diaphorina citri]KAI5740632.1 hypothetical protein M8J76_005707 [Diaphorina citri]
MYVCIRYSRIQSLLNIVHHKGNKGVVTGNSSPTSNVPPPTQINKFQLSATNSLRKDKRQSSSRFNISKNRELEKLPLLKGK